MGCQAHKRPQRHVACKDDAALQGAGVTAYAASLLCRLSKPAQPPVSSQRTGLANGDSGADILLDWHRHADMMNFSRHLQNKLLMAGKPQSMSTPVRRQPVGGRQIGVRHPGP